MFEPGDIIKYKERYYIVIKESAPRGEAENYPVYHCRRKNKTLNIDSYDAINYYHHANSDIDKKKKELGIND